MTLIERLRVGEETSRAHAESKAAKEQVDAGMYLHTRGDTGAKSECWTRTKPLSH